MPWLGDCFQGNIIDVERLSSQSLRQPLRLTPLPKGEASGCVAALGSPFGGKRSAVAVVNDSPVGCQSRDRVLRRALARRFAVTERVYYLNEMALLPFETPRCLFTDNKPA